MAAVKRLTQRDIARLAGVSQATVSLVLNASPAAQSRIPAETRDRVNKVIRDTGYVADPVARRMVKGLNRILGVFTYEPAFPSEQADFFTPFLFGIEEAAQELGYDLLLLTGAGSKRKIFGDNVRLRLADGCVVLGRQFDPAELARLVGGDFPFVAVGRRDDAGGPVPYVGGDYTPATAERIKRAQQMGHERLAYVGPSSGPEATRDRWSGVKLALGSVQRLALHIPHDDAPAAVTLDALLAAGVTAAFFTELADAIKVEQVARQRGIKVPHDLSIVVLGNHIRAEQTGIRFSSYAIPREAMARAATEMLVRRVEDDAPVEQVLLPCEPVEGETLGPVSPQTTRTK